LSVRFPAKPLDKEIKALILAGGLGTRLRSLVSDRPKPMAQVGGKPFLEYQIERLRAHGFEDLVLCVGYLAHHVQDYFDDGRDWGVHIDYAVETEPLGTAGAIKNAQKFIGEDAFLVLNGDSYLEVDLRGLVQFHQRWRSADPQAIATVAVVASDDTSAYGKVELDERARLLRFGEKVEAGPGWINGGVYVLEPTLLDSISLGVAVSLETETLPLILESNHHVLGYLVQGFFVDIGTPEGYHRFCRYVEEEHEAS
jgi:D-glycero-alpha-D-manno-heptose 1-phosphate guanylyltransferase